MTALKITSSLLTPINTSKPLTTKAVGLELVRGNLSIEVVTMEDYKIIHKGTDLYIPSLVNTETVCRVWLF